MIQSSILLDLNPTQKKFFTTNEPGSSYRQCNFALLWCLKNYKWFLQNYFFLAAITCKIFSLKSHFPWGKLKKRLEWTSLVGDRPYLHLSLCLTQITASRLFPANLSDSFSSTHSSYLPQFYSISWHFLRYHNLITSWHNNFLYFQFLVLKNFFHVTLVCMFGSTNVIGAAIACFDTIYIVFLLFSVYWCYFQVFLPSYLWWKIKIGKI